MKIGGGAGKDFTFENSSLHYVIHLNLSFYFRATNKRKALSLDHKKKRDMAVMRHESCCTYLTLVGLLMEMHA